MNEEVATATGEKRVSRLVGAGLRMEAIGQPGSESGLSVPFGALFRGFLEDGLQEDLQIGELGLQPR